MVDASNAFNSLSRPAALWNCCVLWPRCSRFLFNSYRGHAVILLRSQSTGQLHVLLSQEGTTQGCPLAMPMYAIGVYPLISRLKDPASHKQNWYVDDSACGSTLLRIRACFLRLLELGPAFGYFAEPVKSVLVVKEEHLEQAEIMFADLQVKVVLASRFLGGCVGTDDGIHCFVQSKVDTWVHCVERLAEVAKAYPQSAYSAFTRSLSSEWSYLQRCHFSFFPRAFKQKKIKALRPKMTKIASRGSWLKVTDDKIETTTSISPSPSSSPSHSALQIRMEPRPPSAGRL